ncbi:hypothetical protein N0V84_000460 [Fusarium piperis]|uniref:F-box domain-containing protein n=1 Tax=Fusarium piperis TaxID=1435070 RepID=A0A9W8WNC7_9HYPO|nr:hypothetical protein N0V84_000460 [Fusarium piperis]
MDLSRDTSRGLSVIDLPVEILVQVFSYFQHQDFGVRYNGSIYWPSKVVSIANADEPLLTIYNARQVCRLFNTVASPLLCPFLNLKLDQESLDRAEILLANPHIASGVVGIQVSLEYRPIELAEDINQFAAARRDDLGQMNSAVAWCVDEDGPESDHLQAGNYLAIAGAWNHFLGLRPDTAYTSSDEEDDPHQDFEEGRYEPSEAAMEFYDILCQSHKKYVQLQKLQHELIYSRSFINTLSSLASRLNRPLALRIHDSFDADGLWHRHNAFKILTDNAELGKFLLTTYSWGDMNDVKARITLSQVKILSELPIAMHKAGVVLRHLTVGCLPEFNNFDKLCPGENESPDSPAWEELSAACQHLEIFQGEWGGHPVRTRFLDPKYHVYIERYVNSILSNQHFEHVNITLSPYSLDDGNGNAAVSLPHMPGVLSNINWPRVKKVSINSFSLHQEELEHFCDALSSNLEYIGLVSIDLKSGSWVNILHVLRDKMANSSRARVWMADLRGGELGQKKNRNPLLPGFPRIWELEDPVMVVRFMNYVKGELDENPAAKN